MRPRIRSMKPEIHKDEELWDLEEETGLKIFRGFTGLWNYSDREGRFEWRPRALKAEILPYWDGDFERILDALASRRFVVKYTVGGKHYGWVRKLKDHQTFNAREPASVLPAPPPEVLHVHAHVANDTARGELERGTRNEELEGGAGSAPEAPPPPPPPSAPRLRSIRPEQAEGAPLVWHTLKGWEPTASLEDEAVVANISREYFRERVQRAKNKPIGGKDGVISREQWVRDQFPFWVVDQRTEAARAAGSPPARASPNPRASKQSNAGLTGFESLSRSKESP